MGRKNDAFAARMKVYEKVAPWTALPDFTQPLLIRCDGKNFSTYTSKFEPFDPVIHLGMLEATKTLMRAFPGATTAYTQSDEITLIFPAGAIAQHFGGKPQKILSIAGAEATRGFNIGIRTGTCNDKTIKAINEGAVFDARMFNVPSDVEVMNNILFRVRDNVRNAKMGHAQAHISHKRLIGVSSDDAIAIVHGYEDIPIWARIGTIVKRAQINSIGINPKTGEELNIQRTILQDKNIPIDGFSVIMMDILLAKYWPQE